MDSINKQQPEHNREDLSGTRACERMAELVKDADTCFFCTAGGEGPTGGVRPMSVQQVDEEGNLWFLSASDSHKNHDIAANPDVKLFFQGGKHAQFLVLEGEASVSRDQAKIKELWNFVLKTWFTEGEGDPRITAIRVRPVSGYYWDNKHGTAVAGAKMLVGAAIGQTLDDSIEGTLRF